MLNNYFQYKSQERDVTVVYFSIFDRNVQMSSPFLWSLAMLLNIRLLNKYFQFKEELWSHDIRILLMDISKVALVIGDDDDDSDCITDTLADTFYID